MKLNITKIGGLLIGIAALLFAASCAQQSAPTAPAAPAASGDSTGGVDIDVIVVTHGQSNDPFWGIVKNGVDAAAAATGVNAEYRAPATFDMVEMSRLIDTAVSQRPDGIVVSIPDADALGPSIRRAVAAGIPVISINSGSDVFIELGVQAHVGQTEYEAGLGAGRRMASAGASRGICVNHEVGNVALDLRCAGFADGLGGDVRVIGTSNDPTAVTTATSAALRDAGVDAVLTLGPLSALPTLEVLQQTGRLEDVQFGSFDLAPETLQATRDGLMTFLIDQQPVIQGFLPITMFHAMGAFGTLPSGLVNTGPGFVTPDNAADVIALSAQGLR